MPQMYARCNNFMSGATATPGDNCKYIALGESEDEVYGLVVEHLNTVHADKFKDGGYTAADLENTIRRCVFTKGTKPIHNRGPDPDATHS